MDEMEEPAADMGVPQELVLLEGWQFNGITKLPKKSPNSQIKEIACSCINYLRSNQSFNKFISGILPA